jgi:hypothetical protein
VVGRRNSSDYCSDDCRRYIERNRYETLSKNLDISRGTTGAIHQMMVTSDLLSKGYYVFASVSPNSPFDLAVYKRGVATPIRVEVTTALEHNNGKIYLPQKNNRYEFDVIAYVTYTKKILYKKDGLDYVF